MVVQTHVYGNKTILIVADNSDKTQATEWLEFEINEAVHPLESLVVSQAKVLRAANALISAEIARIERILSPSSTGSA